jgi:hypothetical protein
VYCKQQKGNFELGKRVVLVDNNAWSDPPRIEKKKKKQGSRLMLTFHLA